MVTLVLGVGNPLKQDDGVGPYFIQKCLMPNAECRTNVILLDVGTAPENYTGKIKEIKPDTLIIIDAIDFKGQPGEIREFQAADIAIRDFSTHGISLKTFVGFLTEEMPGLKVKIIGIQPKQVGFGEGLSPEVEEAVSKLCTNFI